MPSKNLAKLLVFGKSYHSRQSRCCTLTYILEKMMMCKQNGVVARPLMVMQRMGGKRCGWKIQTCNAGMKDKDSAPSVVDGILFRMAEFLGMVVMEDGDRPTTTAEEEEEELSLGEDSSPMQTGIQGVEQKIENLYQSSYFFSGKGRQDDWDVFADKCVFADEFSSFVGTDRFRRNVTNFGKFLENPECTLTKLERVQGDDGTLSIRASWIFRSRVKWINGLLAAAGETTYVLDGDRVVRHDEAWKTPKSTVFKNIFFNRSQ